MQLSEELLERCRGADRQAQESVYRMAYVPMMRLALRYTYNEQDAADVLNRAMLKVFTKVTQFQGDATNFPGWIRRIVVNEALDFARAQQKRTSRQAALDQPQTLEEGAVSQLMEQERLLFLLQQLPKTSATVFNLYAMEGYSHQEISELLNLSVSNSKWHLYSARKKLQTLLRKSTAL
ncbi:MAG: RNA polymerase sigma factor [Bacteroidota bacterium]